MNIKANERVSKLYTPTGRVSVQSFVLNRYVKRRNKLPDWKRAIATKKCLDSPRRYSPKVKKETGFVKVVSGLWNVVTRCSLDLGQKAAFISSWNMLREPP